VPGQKPASLSVTFRVLSGPHKTNNVTLNAEASS